MKPGPKCSVCSHDLAHLINVALVDRGRSVRAISDEFGPSQTSLKRHAKDHLPELLARAKDAVEVAEADTLLDRVEALYKRTEAILAEAEDNSEYPLALAAIRECRSSLELLGRITKELDERPTVNLHLNPQWIELRATIVAALEPHAQARESVLRALESASNERL